VRNISIILVSAVLIVSFTGTGVPQARAESQVRSLAVSLGHPGAPAPIGASGTGFTYQGRLTDAGKPANGQYDFRLTLFDATSGGNQVGSPLIVSNQTVSGGLFTISLDFGASAYQGDSGHLRIEIRHAGGGTYTLLSPGRSFPPEPYTLSLSPDANVITGHATEIVSNTFFSNGP
jgi:hypothetical protein